MKRYTKADQIKDLIIVLNEKRVKEGKVKVSRVTVGLGTHWLKTEEEHYVSVGRIFHNDDSFIGFLEGLLLQEPVNFNRK
jgi:hypothetical protein